MITISKTTTIIGEIRNPDPIRIDGKVKGDGVFGELVIISPTSVWVGKIVADKILVEGVVEGEIIARKNLQIFKTAKITGKVTAKEMVIDEGAILHGEVVMRKQAPIELNQKLAERKKVEPIQHPTSKKSA